MLYVTWFTLEVHLSRETEVVNQAFSPFVLVALTVKCNEIGAAVLNKSNP